MPRASKPYKGKPVDEKFPEILSYLSQWQLMAFGLRFIHALLGVMAIVFSLLAAAQIGSIVDEYAKIFALIGAISIALMTGFNLGDKSNAVRNAWRLLNGTVIAFNKCEATDKQLIDAYNKEETIIGDVSYSRIQ